MQQLEGGGGTMYAVAFSSDSCLFATGSSDKVVCICEVDSTGWIKQVQKLEGHKHYITDVAFSPDGCLLASASYESMYGLNDSALHIWERDNEGKFQQVQKLEGQGRGIRAIAFSPDGSRLASGSSDQTIWIWAVDEIL